MKRLPPPALALAVLFSIVAPATAGANEPTTVTLRWQARQEEAVYGYLVYRAEDRAGPYRRVSERIVRAAPLDEPAATSQYVFVDRQVQAGRQYFYYLDMVSKGGLKVRFSGVLSKIAGPPAEPPPVEPPAAEH